MNDILCIICGHKTSAAYNHVSVQNLPRRLREAGGFPTKEHTYTYHLTVNGDQKIETTTQVNGPVCHWCRQGRSRCGCGRVLPWGVDTKCSVCNGYTYKRSRPVDAQRRKVYNLEHKLFRAADEVRLTPAEANKLAKRAARWSRTSVPLIEYTRGGGGAAYYNPGFIRIHNSEKRGTTALIVLHEFAHHMVYRIYGPGLAAHGPEFWRCYKEIMAWAGYFKGRYSMGKYRVKISGQQEFWKLMRARPRKVKHMLSVRG